MSRGIVIDFGTRRGKWALLNVVAAVLVPKRKKAARRRKRRAKR